MEIERDPTFRLDDVYDLSKEEWRERTMEKFGLFFGTLSGQANPTQFSYWIQKGAMGLNGVIGCFAMTELGHGSNVAGLETTATFDPASDQFIIHTPTLTATKWWIGGAAHTATHASVFARLIVNNKDYGVKPFIVQLRDTKDFSLRPGVSIGDIGMKMGRNGIDNGWIRFTNVAIPRTNMLMKHTKVTRDGIVKEPPLNQLAYGALIQGRVAMVADSGNVAKKALTIAIRYGVVRRQFASKPGAVETQLIDYTIHQHRLLPLLAQAYAMHFTGVETTKLYDDLMKKLDKLQPNDPNVKDVLDSLKETHATSAGLKAFCTWNCLNTIEQCRQTLGGHGYSSYTGLANMYNDFAVQCSWEGDNTILTLQAGRYLVGCYRDAKKGHKQPEGVGYLNKLPGILTKKSPAKNVDQIVDLDLIGEAFDIVSANLVKKVGDDFEHMLEKGADADAAYEETAIGRLTAAKAHTYGYLFHRFRGALKQCPSSLKPVMSKLCALYGLYNISEHSGAFLQYGVFSATQMDMIKAKVLDLCREIRQDAIPLTDAFDLPDFVLNSPFGRYDGNVYEAYFNHVKARNPPTNPPPYYDRLIKPLLRRQVEEQSEPDDEEEEQEEIIEKK